MNVTDSDSRINVLLLGEREQGLLLEEEGETSGEAQGLHV